MVRENIIISDIHGARDEFNELLNKIKYDKNQHRLILVGDVLDRGNDPIGLLHQIREMNIEMVQANHEEKCLRWRRHQAVEKLTGQKNPMKPPVEQRRKEWEALTDDDLNWLSSLPARIHIKDNWYVVHGGLEPGVPFDKQDPKNIIRIRYVDKNGLFIIPKPGSYLNEDYYFWAEKWSQPYNIIFGHQVFSEPKIFENHNNTCIAIDTGCCFGRKLTAYNLDRKEFISVKAHKNYVNW